MLQEKDVKSKDKDKKKDKKEKKKKKDKDKEKDKEREKAKEKEREKEEKRLQELQDKHRQHPKVNAPVGNGWIRVYNQWKRVTLNEVFF